MPKRLWPWALAAALVVVMALAPVTLILLYVATHQNHAPRVLP